MDALQVALSLGTAKELEIATPLMWIDKAKTWEMAANIGGQSLTNLIIEHTHTCYLGDRSKSFEWGYGCGECPSCELRRAGYEQWVQNNAIKERD